MLPPELADNLAALNAAIAELNATAVAANPEINPFRAVLNQIRPADWDSPVRMDQAKADGEDPYL